MKSTPKISILMATYNGEAWIESQIESILNQIDVHVTIFISDDKSVDNTFKMVENFTNTPNQLKILPNKERQGSAAGNFFRLLIDTDITNTDYIALSDQDDIWLPEKLNKAIQEIKNQCVDAYSSNVKAFWPDGKTRLIHKAQPQAKYDYMFESAGPGCTFVFSQRLALGLQKFLRENKTKLNTVALHDWFIYAFARSRGYQWYIDPTPTLLYRQHADNVVGANTGIKAFAARLSKLKQGWYLQQTLLLAKQLGYNHAAPIQKITRLNLLDRCYLALFACEYRRRLRDRLAFAFFVLFLAKKS